MSSLSGIPLLVLVIAAVLLSAVRSEDSWPNPTCDNTQVRVAEDLCLLYNVEQSTKTDIVFNKDKFDANHYAHVVAYGNTLKFIPKNFFQVFENIKGVRFEKCHLSDIESGDFSNANHLINIDVKKNQIPKIVNFAFAGADNVVELKLIKNQIKTIEPKAFTNLLKLEKLDMSENEIEHLDDEIFAKNLQLKEVVIGNNKLRSAEFITVLSNVNLLWLHDNLFTHVDPNLLSNLHQLKDLSFADNCLTEFNANQLPVLGNLERFHIYGNYLTDLSATGLNQKFPTLVDLYMDHNNFECTYLQEFVNVIGDSKIQIHTETENTPQILGMECKNTGGKDVHEIPEECAAPNQI